MTRLCYLHYWVSLGASATVLCTSALCLADTDGWPSAGRDLQNTRSNPQEQHISPKNVDKLALKWSFTTYGDVSATPVVDNDSVYVPDWGGYIHRVDRKTGKAVWSKSIEKLTGIPGALSRSSPALDESSVIFGTQNGATMFKVRKSDGSLMWATQVSPHPYAVVTSSPVIYHGHVYGGVSSVEELAASDPT